MSAKLYNFTIDQGSSFKLSIVYKDENGIPIDLTGYCARLSWKTSRDDIQVFSTENTNLNLYKFYIDPPNGKITLLFPSSTTNNFDFSTANYDFEIQSPQNLYSEGGKYTIRILHGTIEINKRFSTSVSNMDCAT